MMGRWNVFHVYLILIVLSIAACQYAVSGW